MDLFATQEVVRAIHFAAERHAEQRRKDPVGTPYINHPITVVKVLLEVGGVEDVEVLQAAALHDTVEDTKTTHAELETNFGERVAHYVAEVTDDKSLPKAERKRLQVVLAASKSEGARLIKLADKIANVSDLAITAPVGWDRERVLAYGAQAEQVLEQIRGTHAQLEAELSQAVQQLRTQFGEA